MLLLVPTQPYPGALLPVSMSMLATRNIEYVLYIGALVLVIKSKKILSTYFLLSSLLLGLLFASDKLFLALSLGGGVLGIILYSLVKKWKQVTIAAEWLSASIAGAIFSFLYLWLIQFLSTKLL